MPGTGEFTETQNRSYAQGRWEGQLPLHWFRVFAGGDEKVLQTVMYLMLLGCILTDG